MATKTKKQRKAAARKAARTRAAKKNKKPSKAGIFAGKQWKKISAGAGGLSALSLITSSDMAASTGQSVGVRAKNFTNSILGRVTGYSPFQNDANAGGQIPQTISIEGIFNKYTGIGLGLIGYSMIPARLLPHKTKAKTLGKAVFGGGLIGGIFKPSTNPHNTNLLSQTHSSSVVHNAGVT